MPVTTVWGGGSAATEARDIIIYKGGAKFNTNRNFFTGALYWTKCPFNYFIQNCVNRTSSADFLILWGCYTSDNVQDNNSTSI